MKVKRLLEQLDEFESLLRQFEQARKAILGSPASDSMSHLLAKREQAHHSLDDFTLALMRRYETFKPFIKRYSQCFTSISATEEEPGETYLALISRGDRIFQRIYEDLKHIRTQVEQLDPKIELDIDS